jgi:hypothetical protein
MMDDKEARFTPYLKYIKATGKNPLPVQMFDEDHEPIGPTVRKDMHEAGVVIVYEGYIYPTRTIDGRVCPRCGYRHPPEGFCI